MNCKFILLSFIMLLYSYHIFAINKNAGTTGFSFLKVQYSARTNGMANAFTGLANDADAVFFNTAGLAHNEIEHFKTTYINYIDGLQGGSIIYTRNLDDRWKIAPFVQFMVSDDIPETNIDGVQVGYFSTSHIVAGIGFARELHEVLDFGINAKFYYEKLYEENTATAFVADISILHQTNNENLKLGATLKNVGFQASYFTEAKYEEKIPTVFVGGASYKILDKGYVNLDLLRPFDHDFYARMGVEYFYNDFFTLRLGLDSRMEDYRTNETMDFLSGFAFGFGVNWNKYIIDYGISSMGSLGFVNQISVSYKF